MTNFPYKSICWAFGTTSFRTKRFNKTIEEQLKLLREFWDIERNQNIPWNGNEQIQTDYYNFMKNKSFLEGEAKNKPKDAREKTSGLVDLGIIDDNRRITEAGQSLLSICDKNDFSSDNYFDIEKDSYFYLKQLFKLSYTFDNNVVRPFPIIISALNEFNYLSDDEFTYLLPLCTSKENTKFIFQSIEDYRKSKIDIDEILISYILSYSNYQKALDYFLERDVDSELIMTIGMNRKSRNYDKPYLNLYEEIRNVFLLKNNNAIVDLFNATKLINIGSFWRSHFFSTSSESKLSKSPESYLNCTNFNSIKNEEDLKRTFFEYLHLFKLKATLFDYRDLNRRYIKTTDSILFKDGKVELDIIPKAYFMYYKDSINRICFKESHRLTEDISLEDIIENKNVSLNDILKLLSKYLGVKIESFKEAKDVVEDERIKRFNNLIDDKFSKEKLLYLLDCFETRKDNEIQKYVTDNADIPTIFEYVLGIIWFNLSNRKGKILDYFNLSLDSNLLPKTHAVGGEADIIYSYEKSNKYPKHDLLIEATLSDSTNQRRMEMEPVSRHLGQYLIRTKNYNTYCVFITNYLNINVISDFRGRKNTIYYDTNDYSQFVNGMKIIPIQTSELKEIINKNIVYSDLYELFEKAYKSKLPPHDWYVNEIKELINNY